MKTLDQQLRAIAVDGQAGNAFLAAMEEAVAVGTLSVQFVQQRATSVQGGAQRLVKRRHARRSREGKVRILQENPAPRRRVAISCWASPIGVVRGGSSHCAQPSAAPGRY